MFAHALAVEDFGALRMPRSQPKPIRKGAVSPHQRLVMKAMAVFAGSEIISDLDGNIDEIFVQSTNMDSQR